MIPFVSEKNPLTLIRDIAYVKDSSHRAHLLDLYVPQKHSGPLSVIIWLHGGSWQYYDKANCPAQHYLPKDFAIASLNYSYSSEAVFPAQLHDCQAAVRWIRANAQQYDFNVNKIGAWGVSAGAYLASFLGTTGNTSAFGEPHADHGDQSTMVQAVSAWAGPSNLDSIGPQLGYHRDEYPSKLSFVSALLGGDLSAEKLKSCSPITYATSSAPPFFLMHGAQDDLVPLAQSQELYDALVNHKAPVSILVDEQSGHDLMTRDHIIETMRFFERTIGPWN